MADGRCKVCELGESPNDYVCDDCLQSIEGDPYQPELDALWEGVSI